MVNGDGRPVNGAANKPGTSLRAWCKAHGVAPSVLHKAVTAGHVTRAADGWLDTASADRWLAQRGTLPSRRPAGSGAPRPGSVAASMKRLTEYRARLARLDYLARKGELVSAAEVQAAAFRAGRALRDSMTSISARVSSALAGMTDAGAIHELLEREIALALDEFASSALPRSTAKSQ